MKYNININQKGLEYDKEITLIESSVLGWIHDFCGSNNKKINANKVDGWTLVRGQFLVDDMPLLRIKSRSGGTRLLHRVAKLGYIETKVEPRKLFIKPTSKMDKLWFGDEALEEQTEALDKKVGAVEQQSCSLEATYHNTNTITHTNTNITETIIDTNAVTLPLIKKDGTSSGKTNLDRLLFLYSKLFFNIYMTNYRVNWGRDKGVFKSMIKDYTEVQIAYMLCIYFDWHGMSGSDSRDYDFVTGATFPITLFKSMAGKFEIYIKNVLMCNFEDDNEMLKKVGEYLKNIK